MGGVADDWERLRTTFDTAAELYQQARPEYPEPLYDTLVDLTGVGAGDRVVEVGCATGKATLPLAGRGLRITCVEIGPGLASVARQNLSALPNVEVIEGAFETWQPPDSVRFDLVFAATAWHWIDPAVRYRRAWELLARAGTSRSGRPHTCSPTTVTRSSPRSRTSTTRSAKRFPRVHHGHPARSLTIERRSSTAACSATSSLATSTGRSATPRTSTSACLIPSPATSPCTPGNATASTQKSAGASPSDRTAVYAAAGEPSCTSPVEPAQNPLRKIPDRS